LLLPGVECSAATEEAVADSNFGTVEGVVAVAAVVVTGVVTGVVTASRTAGTSKGFRGDTGREGAVATGVAATGAESAFDFGVPELVASGSSPPLLLLVGAFVGVLAAELLMVLLGESKGGIVETDERGAFWDGITASGVAEKGPCMCNDE